ncbi:MAG: NAD(P)H-hydrate epimerase [Candidatus Omnitrophota bacterium]
MVKKTAVMAIDSLAVDKLRELEAKARKLGLNERLLIENASSNLYAVIEKLKFPKNVLAVAGRGNNGADVAACARKMIGRGYKVSLAVVAPKELNRECAFQIELLKNIAADIFWIKKPRDTDSLDKLISRCSFILDGILGIGVKGTVDPFLRKVIKKLNDSGRPIVACDIPSGLCPERGKVLGEAINARATVTFIAPKRGFFLGQGVNRCGKIFVVDIGISRDSLDSVP